MGKQFLERGEWRMEVPLALLQQQHQKESGFPAGGAQGGWRRSGGGSFYFQIHNSNIDIQSSQHLVRQLGRLVRNLWHAAHSRMPRVSYFAEAGLKSESGQVVLTWYFVVFVGFIFSTWWGVCGLESARKNKSNSEREPFIAVQREQYRSFLTF